MEGEIKRKTTWPKDSFTDFMLSWSLLEILDGELYQYQVERIPDTFQNVDDYLGSYVYPLMEEMRAELASAMETAYKAPFAEVTNIYESQRDTLQFHVQVDHWRNRVRDRDGEPYKTLPGDLLLFTESKPETDSDILRDGWEYALASVRSIPHDDDDVTSTNFEVEMKVEIDDEYAKDKSLYIIFLMNTTPLRRIWKALHMRRNLTIIEKLLRPGDLAEEECPHGYNHELIEGGEMSHPLSNLNESQKDAIAATLCKTEFCHTPFVDLIWGPPGTGKTATLSVLIYALLRKGVKTLVCAPTNVAITQLASRVVQLLTHSDLTCPLGDLLMFGNKDRLRVGSDIEEIFLDHRLEKLANCLLPATGWRSSVCSMIKFLEDGVSDHKIYLENALAMKENNSKDGYMDIQHSKPKQFLQYARDAFVNIAKSLRESVQVLSTHLRISFILEHNIQRMDELMSLLDSMESLLFEGSRMTSEKLKTIFLETGSTSSESLDDSSSLPFIKTRCLSVLKSLRGSFDKLISNKIATQEFCFRNASLIFCTTSSSFKLHSVDMEPFDLLVIDEAVQVKECESIIPLQIPNVRYVVLVGDECQLTATVTSKLSEKAGFGKSLFQRLSSMGHPKLLLNMQYRMHPAISQFPNLSFYQNQILDAPLVQSEGYEKCYLQGKMFGPYSFINIHGTKEEFDDVGHSIRNLVEVAVVVKLVNKLYRALSSLNPKEKLNIGLISPYVAQVAAIRDRLPQHYTKLDEFVVKVKSIDGFQGGEEDIIIISTVRSNNAASIGFLSSPQRTNVALTRARKCLGIVGNEGTLGKTDSIWESLITDAKERKCFFNADEDADLKKTVIDVKKELEQLDDLLSSDSMLFKNSRWKVLFSDNFRKSFQMLKPSNVKKLAINLVLKLASGWRPKYINVDSQCETCLHLVKQFKVERYYIVCTIDLMKDSTYRQVLKVWDILPETTKLLKRLNNIFSMYTDDFIKHCNDKLYEGKLEVPRSYSESKKIIRYKDPSSSSTAASTSATECVNYAENSRVSESLLLMKFYSLSSGTVNHLLSDPEGREVDLPFEVTDEEREIVRFTKSSFIVGRSGTGKTTILTMKLFQKLQHFAIASDNSQQGRFPSRASEDSERTLHQIFVTVSPKLCYAVKKNISQLKSFAFEGGSSCGNGIDIDDIDEMVEFRDIPNSFVGIKQEKYPLIITFRKFLMMLDGTIGCSYFERFCETRHSCQNEDKRSVVLQTFIRKNEVTFDRFRFSYWPHFNANLTKNLDTSRVFTEIMSHIKGGCQEGEAFERRNRHSYIALSDSRASTLTADKREVIYDIFEDYERLKMHRREFDLADFVMDVHLRLKNENLVGDKMDFVYIDEVQDLTMNQIRLFSYVCKNVEEGFVFCGDTAQTIARGIDFRFQDIRSLFYKEFLMKSSSGRKEKGFVSDMFNLTQNFRTHTGVLRLAQSVINLISHFFPQAIDALAPETSLIYGEPPIVLEPGSDENSIISIFGHTGAVGEKWVGFGADQVILVRDASAKDEVSALIGNQALILTIVECKGLEFQDVLLYNFFGSSPMSNQWRVVYEFLKEKDLLDPKFSESFPRFNQSRHNILCSELKQLYVAITRTRQRLWICENSEEFSGPMLNYWRSLCLVQVRKMDNSLAQVMQRASSPAEWKSQGIKLFWEENYEMATMCFEKAGEETWEKRAKATGLKSVAENLRGSNSEERRVMLRKAAEIFESIGRAGNAAECFCDLEDYENAGRCYLEKSELSKAGECFSLAGNYGKSAQVFAKGNFFNECLSSCNKGNLFDLGLQYIVSWRQDASWNTTIMTRFKDINQIAQEFLEKCASKCHERKDGELLMKFVRAFDTMESKRIFMKSLNCLEELLLLEEECGNFDEAAEIAMLIGDVRHEIDILINAGKFENASLLILSYATSNSLWGSGRLYWPLKSFDCKEELLAKAMSIAEKVTEQFYVSVCAEAKVLSHEQMHLSELMQCYCTSKQYSIHLGEIFSLQKILDVHFQIHQGKYEWEPQLQMDSRLLDERILRNEVSIATLVYIWNLWKQHVFEIIECVESLERLDVIKSEGLAQCCFNYFGVRLQQTISVKFQLMNPNAAWIKHVDTRFLVQSGKVVTLEACHFWPAAKKHWCQDLVSVGLKVLETLKSLYMHSMSRLKTFSTYHRSVCLTCIFEITKFLVESKAAVDMKKTDGKKLQDFHELSTEYFGLAFPLDSRQALSESMVSLRDTHVSQNLLEDVLLNNLNSKGEITSYGQIGRVVMILLGSGKKPKHDLCDKIVQKFPGKSYWKSFIEKFVRFMELHSPSESVSSSIVKDAMCHELYMALQETYLANWRVRDYITPHCFFYLVERLLILVPLSQRYLFATKSSIVEYLLSLPQDANPSGALTTKPPLYAGTIFDFVFDLLRQCLSGFGATEEWFRVSHMNNKSYFPMLVLKLLVILCLLCLNSEFNFNVVFDWLKIPHIRFNLPKEFVEALRCRKSGYTPYPALVAGAFKAIGDPLVVVTTGGFGNFSCRDAIALDLRSFSSRSEVMKTLFPSRAMEKPIEKSIGEVSSKGVFTAVHSSETQGNTISKCPNVTLQINWFLIRDAIESLGMRKDPSLENVVLRKKAEVEEHLGILEAAMLQLSEERSHAEDDKTALCEEAISIIKELKVQFSLFHTRELDSKDIGVVLKRLEAMRPELDRLTSDPNKSNPSCSNAEKPNNPSGLKPELNSSCTSQKPSSESNEEPEPEPNPSAAPKPDEANSSCTNQKPSNEGKGKKKKKQNKKGGKGKRK